MYDFLVLIFIYGKYWGGLCFGYWLEGVELGKVVVLVV